eukprot:SAG31_NODE_9006_length_1349_cov_1.299200_2_plen_157_part_00
MAAALFTTCSLDRLSQQRKQRVCVAGATDTAYLSKLKYSPLASMWSKRSCRFRICVFAHRGNNLTEASRSGSQGYSRTKQIGSRLCDRMWCTIDLSSIRMTIPAAIASAAPTKAAFYCRWIVCRVAVGFIRHCDTIIAHCDFISLAIAFADGRAQL